MHLHKPFKKSAECEVNKKRKKVIMVSDIRENNWMLFIKWNALMKHD